MGLTKHASFQVLSAKIATEGAPLLRTAHRVEFNYTPRPGFLYVRSRAISSRCNDNFDEFPAAEIKQAYRTFIGKPVFVNHHNENHRRARGVIIDAALHEDVNPDGTPDTWAEVLMEVDAIKFPKLAEAIVKGHIDRTSMGTDVAYSVCSFCGNKAASPVEYCKHIPRMKGQRIYRTTASGEKEGVLVREICYGLGFFENSLLVEQPADPTAYFLGVDASGVPELASMAKAASKDPRFDGVTVDQDEKGFYVRTHRARSDSYETPEQIPDSTVEDIRSTGAKTAALTPGSRIDFEGEDAQYGEPVSAHGVVKSVSEQDWGDGRVKVSLTYVRDGESTPRSLEVWKSALGTTAARPGEPDDRQGCTIGRSDTVHAWDDHYKGAVCGSAPRRGARAYFTRTSAPVDCARCLARQSKTAIGSSAVDVPARDLRRGDLMLDRGNAYPDHFVSVTEVEFGDGAIPFVKITADDPMRGEPVIRSVKPDTRLIVQRTAAHTALLPGEVQVDTPAPKDVDTLRVEQCPVCGETDAFDGEQCQVCGFIAPPPEFGDPDLEVAREVDLHQEADEESDGTGDLVCDSCGARFPTAANTKQAVVLDKDRGADQETPGVATKDGDACPSCGNGVLHLEATPKSDDGFAPAGSASKVPASSGDDDFAPAGSARTKTAVVKTATAQPPATRQAGTQKEESMRPALAALAAQQAQIDAHSAAIARIATLAGLEKDPIVVRAVRKHAEDENPAQPSGWANPSGQGTEAPAATTEEAKQPEAKDDVTSQGATPVTDVTPDSTTSVTSTEPVLDVPLDLNEQDPTQQVAGTDDAGNGARGQSGTNRVETDVRISAPHDTSDAFRDGGFLGSKAPSQQRIFAALRLARLQMKAGLVPADTDDMALGQTIASGPETDETIQTLINTLAQVTTGSQAQAAPTPVAARRLVPQVPRTASVERTVPSMVPGMPDGTVHVASSGVSDDEMVFE